MSTAPVKTGRLDILTATRTGRAVIFFGFAGLLSFLVFVYGLLQEQELARRDQRAQAAHFLALKTAFQDYQTTLLLHMAEPSKVLASDALTRFTVMEERLLQAQRAMTARDDARTLAAMRAGLGGISPAVLGNSGATDLRRMLLALTAIQGGLTGLEATMAERGDALSDGLAMHRTAQVLMGLSAVALLLLIARLLINQSNVMQLLRRERDTIDRVSAAQLAAIEAAPDGIVILDGEGRITFMNRAFALMHYLSGPGRKESIHKHWADLYDADGAAQVRNVILPAASSKGYWRGPSGLHNSRGKPFAADLSLTALDPDGLHGAGYIGTALDITEKQAREKETEALRLQYYQSQKMESLGRLAGGIAHDFNNILAAIAGYAEFLTQDLERGSTTHGFAEKIMLGTQRAKSLIEQILNFSRANDRGREEVDLNRAVAEAVSMLRASLSSGVAIETQQTSDAAIVSANATQVSQALMNLCVNAQDAMNGRGTLRVSVDITDASKLGVPAHMQTDDGDGSKAAPVHIEMPEAGHTVMLVGPVTAGQAYARVSVTDTGSGIPRDVAEHMFEPFFTTKDVHKGTGLGLASVHGILISHRGFLRVDTMMDRGSSFEMLFPLKADVANAEADEDELDIGGQQSGRILVVDDEDTVRAIHCTMLERAGYEVFDSATASEALDLIRDNPLYFDAVVSDYAMPVMTGVELAQAAMNYAPALPFVLVSGYAEDQTREMMAQVPTIRAFLKKPVQSTDLVAHVRNTVSALKGA